MSFTPAELRLLAISDHIVDREANRSTWKPVGRPSAKPRPGRKLKPSADAKAQARRVYQREWARRKAAERRRPETKRP
jgi:hypothetical protein